MHVFLFTGIAVALLLAELTGFSAGGIVAAGYLAMFALQPGWLIGTLTAALLTYGVLRLVQNKVLLYGRRLFAVYILTGMFISQAAAAFLIANSTADMGLMIVGYLIPGLIARDFARQGIVLTVCWTTVAVVLTRLAVLAGEGWLW